MTDLASAFEEFAQRVDEALRPPAGELVAAYFDPAGNFAADTFDTLGRNDWGQISIDDLLAVTMLDVRVMPLAIRAILGEERDALSTRLTAVPADVPLWDATDHDLSAATALWQFLKGHRGIDWVTAGKLLARKRPLLIPVYDSVIKGTLNPPGSFWEALRQALSDKGRRETIENLRPSGLTSKVSTIRLLDVTVWMRNSQSTNARRARSAAGLEITPRR